MPGLTFGALGLCILLGGVGTCFATSVDTAIPAEDYIDDKLLSQGASEVGVMNTQQLEAFIDYLAVCDAMSSTKDDARLTTNEAMILSAKSKRFDCDIAANKFIMKNKSAAALHRVVRAMDLIWAIVEFKGEDPAKISTYINRRAEIFRVLQSSASARYAALIKQDASKTH
jgi:hypothetical protein